MKAFCACLVGIIVIQQASEIRMVREKSENEHYLYIAIELKNKSVLQD